MEKVLFDTNLYIEYFRNESHAELFESRTKRIHLALPVLGELNAGAVSRRDRKLVSTMLDVYEKNGRVVLLQPGDFFYAGEIIRKIRNADIGRGFFNDCLIAISALRIGATVYTLNRRDFNRIGSVLRTLRINVPGA